MRSIFVPGKPFAKERPRLGGAGRVYTPGKTLSYEAKIGNLWSIKYQDLMVGHLELYLWCYFPVPEAASRIKKEQMLAGNIFPATSKDWDNISKIVCDGLNLIAYHDDRQIAEAHVFKRYSERPGLKVILETIC